MYYFLKKTKPTKKDTYLQIYVSYYDANTKSKKQKCHQSLGYVEKLKTNEIKDPIEFYQKVVDELNKKDKENKELKISDKSTSKFLGHFLIKGMFDLLNMDNDLNIVGSTYKCHYKFSDLFRTLCYAQILSPGSKLKFFENVIPNIYNANTFSYDQILDYVNFLGSDYHKYIEVLNKHINDNWKRNLNTGYFDCTNYYFEIDLENDTLKKGPSKENKRCPLLGQALLLDADQIPLDTEFYPGNESEKQYLRKRIEDIKSKNSITGRLKRKFQFGIINFSKLQWLFFIHKFAEPEYAFSFKCIKTTVNHIKQRSFYRFNRQFTICTLKFNLLSTFDESIGGVFPDLRNCTTRFCTIIIGNSIRRAGQQKFRNSKHTVFYRCRHIFTQLSGKFDCNSITISHSRIVDNLESLSVNRLLHFSRVALIDTIQLRPHAVKTQLHPWRFHRYNP